MSESRRKYVGYPNAKNRPDTLFIYPPGKGGGGSFCLPTTGKTSHAEKIEVSKFLVLNRYLILLNSFSPISGVGFYTNAGESCGFFGCCDNSQGDPMDWWIALSAQGELTDEEIVKNGVRMESPVITGNEDDQLIEFPFDKLPQPVFRNGGANPNWQNEIWYQIYWGDPNAMTYTYRNVTGASSPTESDFEPLLQITSVEKHDFDIEV